MSLSPLLVFCAVASVMTTAKSPVSVVVASLCSDAQSISLTLAPKVWVDHVHHLGEVGIIDHVGQQSLEPLADDVRWTEARADQQPLSLDLLIADGPQVRVEEA